MRTEIPTTLPCNCHAKPSVNEYTYSQLGCASEAADIGRISLVQWLQVTTDMPRIGFGGTEETLMSIKHATRASEERSNAMGSTLAQDVSDLQSNVNITHCLGFRQFSNLIHS
ncbi:hypothetical protein CEP54_009793 [Fusarium duplospermum]|uniref:Uncharacterized protein n=1 Tax=Fusarium duplospermum TaxID=1325734 RepID=A0A428PNP3_9HYPO|nr:hypothetical protein CEP54_009793 [Fusarium duplospermum]